MYSVNQMGFNSYNKQNYTICYILVCSKALRECNTG